MTNIRCSFDAGGRGRHLSEAILRAYAKHVWDDVTTPDKYKKLRQVEEATTNLCDILPRYTKKWGKLLNVIVPTEDPEDPVARLVAQDGRKVFTTLEGATSFVEFCRGDQPHDVKYH